MVEITGNIDFANHLERIAFNALPAQISDDFMTKQYFQQPNQVMVTRHHRNFDQDHEGADLAFGALTGYPMLFFEYAPRLAKIYTAPMVCHT